MEKIYDATGKELTVGDTVFFIDPRYKNLTKGKIVRFSPKMVTVEYYRARWDANHITSRPASDMVKVEVL